MTAGKNFIAGRWVPGGGAEFQSINPADGTVLWQGRASDAGDVDAAVAAARRASLKWSDRPFDERIGVLECFSAKVAEYKEKLAEIISMETGKVYWDALGEAGALAAKLEISIRAYKLRTGRRSSISGDIRSRLEHRPHGVMAVFGPFNFPAHLPNGQIIPALLAGNTVVFKPSELTPCVAQEMVRIWQAAALDKGVLNLLQGGRETGQALVEHEGIDGLLFTGSPATGRAIAKALAGRPEVILALELGGNNALLVDKVGDLKAAAVLTILSAFITSGQRCTCARRLIVPIGHEGDDFIEALAIATAKIRVGAFGDEPEAFMGPLVSEGAANAVLASEASLIKAGGVPIRKLERLDRGPAFLSPGLIDVTAIKERADQEIFGPLLQIIRVSDLEEGIEEVNNTRYGLAAGILTDNEATQRKFYRRARAGLLNWNRPTTGASGEAPFGGIGGSGNNRPGGYYTADFCSYPVASLEEASGAVRLEDLPRGLDP